MKEIIHIQVGTCGNVLGTKFWDLISNEHGIDRAGVYNGNSDKQLEKMSYFYKETKNRKYFPRSIQVDLKPKTLTQIKATNNLFTEDNYLEGTGGGHHNWAKGYYTDGAEIIDEVLEVIRKEAEGCEYMEGFHLCHSLGGGTGSGLGTLIISKLKEEYPRKLVQAVSVFPSHQFSVCVQEPYNFVLGVSQLVEYADVVVVLDNGCDMSHTVEDNPTYAHINQLFSATMAGVTSSIRFTSEINSDLRSICNNLVPFPRLHFLLVGLAPITYVNSELPRTFPTVRELFRGMREAKNMMCAVDPRFGRYLTSYAQFRGYMKRDIYEESLNIGYMNSSSYVEWIPNNLQYNISDIPVNKSAIYMGNSTSIQGAFRRIKEQFSVSFRRKAFLWSYCNEGMDEMEFSEAEDNVGDLIAEYLMYQDAAT